jgi:hypothetical protein
MSERSGTLADDPFGGRQPTSHERMTGLPWDASYSDGPAPWDIGQPQPALVRLASEGGSPAGPAARPAAGMTTALRPLVIDVGVPLGTYYLLHGAFGLSVWLSLALSSVGPAIRALFGIAAERKLNVLAVLMLAVNLSGIVVSFLTGDPRAMIAKDSLVSSVIAFAILSSVLTRRPLMSAGLRPFMTQGMPERSAAWDRLAARSARFRRFELLYSTIWGVALLADCAARLVGAYTLPVTTMVWMSTVLTLSAVGVGVMVGGVAAMPILRMIETEVKEGLTELTGPARTMTGPAHGGK